MKRTVHITANDKNRELVVCVTATIESKNGLTRGEVNAQALAMSRSIARALESVPYSDFGIDNTRVRV